MEDKEDKTVFTLKQAQSLYQTLADILGGKYNINVTAKVEEK